jgi:hypothetical protein
MKELLQILILRGKQNRHINPVWVINLFFSFTRI